MFLIKGENPFVEQISAILLSVDMKKENLLVIYDVFPPSLHDVNMKTINTINRIDGKSKNILTNKDKLIHWFSTIKYPASLPAIIFSEINEKDIKEFLSRGSKHKYLKAKHGWGAQWIYMVDSLESIKRNIYEKESLNAAYMPERLTPALRGWILQDALEDIATFDGYKFHLFVLLIVTVRNGKVSVAISNYHTYVFAGELYDPKKIMNEDVHITHKRKNSKTAYFPMETPDRWTLKDSQKKMAEIKNLFANIFKEEHDFSPKYSVKNGFEIFGADIIFDKKHTLYILEINNLPVFYPSRIILHPEIFHLGLGGAPMSLFSTIYGTPENRVTPFTKPLTKLYKSIYTSKYDVQYMFNKLFYTNIDEGANAYLMYQTMTTKKIRRTTRKTKRYRS